MMSIKPIFLLIATLVAYITLSTCAVYQTAPQTHPDHPGKCWWTKTSQAYGVGEQFKVPNSCSQALCNSDFTFTVTGCGLRLIDDPSCHAIDRDLSLPHPACCANWECTDAQGKITRF